MSDLLALSDEVAAALAEGGPVVALESTIITHGLPFPQNLETARAVEAEVRAGGGLPATIAVRDGKMRVGLDDRALEALARTEDAVKVSRADLATTLAGGRTGSTTVAATTLIAHQAGIQVFATGGIGGVHRGAEHSFDISADLDELARTPVIVVSAGAKALLDLPKTLEVLETRGVPVIGYRTDDFPAFWSRSSGLKVPMRADDPSDIARIQWIQRRLGLDAGLLIANPVPEANEIPAADMKHLIEAAQAAADRDNVTGKAVTPFILSRIAELSDGRSIDTNIALIRNNARLAAEIARAVSDGVRST